MQVAIIAGGLATRLGSLTRDIPKSLIRVQDKPFIEYQFEFLKAGGVKDIVLCLGFLGKQIEAYCGDGRQFGVNLQYSYEKELLDTAGALKLAAPLLQDPFFTLYGDSYVSLDFRAMWRYFNHQNILAAMSVYKNCHRYDRSNTAIAKGFVTQYRKENTAGMQYIDYGVNLFRREVLSLIPASEPYSMSLLFQDLIGRRELLAYEVKKRFYQCGSLEGLQEFSELCRSKK